MPLFIITENYGIPLNMVIEGNLLPDIMVNILLRPPGKSLVCFKSVYKSWYALINSISVTSMHVLEHLPTNTEKLLGFGIHSTEIQQFLYCNLHLMMLETVKILLNVARHSMSHFLSRSVILIRWWLRLHLMD